MLHGGGIVVPSELGKIGNPEVIRIWYPIEVFGVGFSISRLVLRLDAEVVPDDVGELLLQPMLPGKHLVAQIDRRGPLHRLIADVALVVGGSWWWQ